MLSHEIRTDLICLPGQLGVEILPKQIRIVSEEVYALFMPFSLRLRAERQLDRQWLRDVPGLGQTVQVWNFGRPTVGIQTPGDQAFREGSVPMPSVW